MAGGSPSRAAAKYVPRNPPGPYSGCCDLRRPQGRPAPAGQQLRGSAPGAGGADEAAARLDKGTAVAHNIGRLARSVNEPCLFKVNPCKA